MLEDKLLELHKAFKRHRWAINFQRSRIEALETRINRDNQLLSAVKALFEAEQSEGGPRFGHVHTPATREHQCRVYLARKALHKAVAEAEAQQRGQ